MNSIRIKLIATAALGIAFTSPALADDGTIHIVDSAAIAKDIPSQLKRSHSNHYRSLFRALDTENWDQVKSLLDSAPESPLKSIAQAEYFLAANSPRAELGPLLNLVGSAPQIPQAEQLGRLAEKRGAQVLPAFPQRQRLSYVAGAPIRSKPTSVNTDIIANGLRGQIIDYIKSDSPSAAETLLNDSRSSLSSEAITEFEQRIAWSYYIENDDISALRIGRMGQNGSGSWVVHSDWVAGLAAWRLKDCQTASQAFEKVGRRGDNSDMRAAGNYWAARSDMVCGNPEKVQAKLQAAAAVDDSFYGILAAEALGMATTHVAVASAFEKGDWKKLSHHENVKTAIALVEIGEDGMADEVLRHQATIGEPEDHSALLKMARELSLPRTQLWLAHHAPQGYKPDAQARFPAPKWTPDGGWRVDPALVYAHTLQESAFRQKAVSGANAIGLMQLRPGSANDIAKARGDTFAVSQLYKPSTNLEYGQSYLEYLNKMSLTDGKLPKIVAAYNAGPGSVQRWNTEIRDNDDPLLFMESIPYVETRSYVSIVMRNYWMYEQQAGLASESLGVLSQNQWPQFPNRPSKAQTRFVSR